jgi:hypothetical protein
MRERQVRKQRRQHEHQRTQREDAVKAELRGGIECRVVVLCHVDALNSTSRPACLRLAASRGHRKREHPRRRTDTRPQQASR